MNFWDKVKAGLSNEARQQLNLEAEGAPSPEPVPAPAPAPAPEPAPAPAPAPSPAPVEGSQLPLPAVEGTEYSPELQAALREVETLRAERTARLEAEAKAAATARHEAAEAFADRALKSERVAPLSRPVLVSLHERLALIEASASGDEAALCAVVGPEAKDAEGNTKQTPLTLVSALEHLVGAQDGEAPDLFWTREIAQTGGSASLTAALPRLATPQKSNDGETNLLPDDVIKGVADMA